MSWHDGGMPKLLPVLDPTPRRLLRAVGVRTALRRADAKTSPSRLKALADPARLRLLSLMMANEDLEACTCDLTDALGLTPADG